MNKISKNAPILAVMLFGASVFFAGPVFADDDGWGFSFGPGGLGFHYSDHDGHHGRHHYDGHHRYHGHRYHYKPYRYHRSYHYRPYSRYYYPGRYYRGGIGFYLH